MSERASANPIKIVGIGASAGGLEAFHRFFEAMPADSGLAFVVILHLPANRRSMLPDIIARWTSMRVIGVDDQAIIEPNCIYVPHPHAITTLAAGRLIVRQVPPDAPRDDRPIDGFFDSLATQLGENAVGIVMSGTGTDGSLGLKAIKECGGLTIAQGEPSDAASLGRHGSRPQFEGMPSGAIATGAVDLIANVESMPGHLMRLRAPAAPLEGEPDLADAAAVRACRLRICEILRAQLGHDFSGYKEPTFLRRVQRRMQVRNIDTMESYVAQLEGDREEIGLLFRDLLIRVTSFFRDVEIFDVLAELAIPRLFEGKHAEHTVRVWVPGCATGEEAYSLAMLLREYMDRLVAVPKVQIFATDIDEPAIAMARTGRYPKTLLEGLSAPRLARFFQDVGTGYVVGKEIRELCTFSSHSLVRDPPFSRMDMISCRNLLIYLDIDLQGKVIPAFHYSLNPGGVLLLGSSETAARFEDLFTPLDKPARIFLRRNGTSPPLRLYEAGLTRDDPGRDRPAMLPKRSDRPTSASADAPSPAGSVGDAGLARGGDKTKNGGDGTGFSWMNFRNSGVGAAGGTTARGMRWALRAAAGWLHPASRDVELLQQDLANTHEKLRLLGEEHATAVEELRSANEELHSVNEEIQSTNEELETSK